MSFLARELCTRAEDQLSRITLTAVELTPDLKSARIFWTYNQFAPVGVAVSTTATQTGCAETVVAESKATESKLTDAELQQVEEALRLAKPSLRKRLADELNLRYTPQLEFRYDRSVENGSRIEALLKQVSSGG
jgi:ribosome-binding factor A